MLMIADCDCVGYCFASLSPSDVKFNERFHIVGADIKNYLLEKVSLNERERSD